MSEARPAPDRSCSKHSPAAQPPSEQPPSKHSPGALQGRQPHGVRSHGVLPTDELRRVARQLNLPGFGMEQQLALHNAHVLIIGAGGLGCPALQQLAAAGVGHITIIDDDVVDITNIHRQILFGASDVGRSKVAVANERARQLQPGITVTALDQRLSVDNAVELCSAADIVLDGSDNFATKYLVADACEITGTALVWGTVLRYHGQVALFHSSSAQPESTTLETMPLERRPLGGYGVGLRDLFGAPPAADSVPDCATAGVLGVTTSVIAGLMTTAAIGHLTGLDSSIGRITSYHAMPTQFTTFTVTADPERELVTELPANIPGDGYPHRDGIGNDASECSISPHDHDSAGAPLSDAAAAQHRMILHAAELLSQVRRGHAVLVDIREEHEVILDSLPHDPGIFYAPSSQLGTLDDLHNAVPETTGLPTVIMCAAGQRSASLIERFTGDSTAGKNAGWASGKNTNTLHNLPGGIRTAHAAWALLEDT